MFARVFLIVLVLVAVPTWSQAVPSATGYDTNTGDDDVMQTPPPVSGEAYPAAIGPEAPSNFLRGGVVVNAAYNDNLFASASTAPISDMSYSIWPTIAINESTPRSHSILTYSPGFTIYQHTSAWNQQNQNLSFDSQYRLSPHIAMSVHEGFLKSSNILNQSNPLSGITVSGSAQSSTVPIIAPFANQTSNIVSGGLTYQINRDDMIGGSGMFDIIHYPNPSEATGLYNSTSHGGTAFYNHRLSARQYFGTVYQFLNNLDTAVTATSPARGNSDVHSALLFYTIYLNSTLSFSVLAGPQHYNVSALPEPPSAAWTPAVKGSIGWQSRRVNIAASYSREINVGGGLLGAFNGTNASISGQWRIARTWGAGIGANYTTTTNVSRAMSLLYPGGDFASGTVAVHHELSEHLKIEAGYTRLNQSYGYIAAISNNANADQEYISVSYQVLRPLGR